MKSLILFLYLTIITIFNPTHSYSQTLSFPDELDGIYKKWEGMTDIQKKEFLQGYKGNLISGVGKIISIKDGGSVFGCERSKHTWLFGIFPDCYKVSVIRIAPECVTGGLDAFGIKIPGVQECLKLHTTQLYFSKKEKAKLLTLKNGETLNYSNCKILYISNHFYSEVFCDAQFPININQENNKNNKNIKSKNNANDTDISNIIFKEREFNEKCRGGSGDNPKTIEACDARDALVLKLNKLSWCFGKENQSGYEMSWHQCEANSYRK